MEIIVLNGAPGSGKDTLARWIFNCLDNVHHMSFKYPLYEVMCRRYSLTMDEVKDLCSVANKNTPSGLLDGFTPVQCLIDISENIIRKEHGTRGVSIHAVKYIRDIQDYQNKTFVFSDSGILEEYLHLKEEFPNAEFTLVRILRDGCTFESRNDIRGYLPDPDIVLTNHLDPPNRPLGLLGLCLFEDFIAEYYD